MRQNKAAKLQDIKQTWRRQAKKGTRPERKRIPYISKQINACPYCKASRAALA